jgi:hypothetical protein
MKIFHQRTDFDSMIFANTSVWNSDEFSSFARLKLERKQSLAVSSGTGNAIIAINSTNLFQISTRPIIIMTFLLPFSNLKKNLMR